MAPRLQQVGLDPIFHGKKLFRILCDLKNFGRGRIVYHTSEQGFPEPSFYRILLAQPEMDPEDRYGRIVAERVYRGKRFSTPQNLAGPLMKFPCFRLVLKDQEESFCRWAEVEDYVPAVHAPERPQFMEMPPLMRLVMERNRKARATEAQQGPEPDQFLLPAFKVYDEEGEEPVRIVEGAVEPHSMNQFLTDKFATHLDFDMAAVPTGEWNRDRIRSRVGHKIWPSYSEGHSFGYKELVRRDQEDAASTS